MVSEREAAVPRGTRSLAAAELMGAARRFGRRWALRGVSVRVEPGETVALAGANGSGKTTLLRILATALRPTRGGGRVFDHDLVAEADAVRPLVGLLGHMPGLYDDLTAAENLRFSLAMAGLPPAPVAVAQAITRAGLGEVADERVRGFSSGMRRRLALARLLLRPPRLLLLDEPYASFDAGGVDLINAFIRDVAAGGGAVLVATHDLARGAGVLERVVRLEAGLLVEDRSIDGSQRDPASVAGGPDAAPAMRTAAQAGAGGHP